MEYRDLGKTGLKVSAMGFGGIPIQKVNQEEANEIVRTAVEGGINFFDTARGYTDSEEKLGHALKGQRDKVILATKSMARTKDKMAEDIEISLKNLQTDYIDLYQLHNVKTEKEVETVFGPNGALEALIEAKEAGKIRFIGITGHKAEVLVEVIDKYDFATIQFPANFLEDMGEKELFPKARAKGMGIIVMKPLAGGAFQRKDLALRFLLGEDYTTIIPGMGSVEEVQNNAALAKDFQRLNNEEIKILEKEAKELGSEFCRRCEYCKPCPQDLDIPGFFLIHGYFKRYGLGDWAIERYNTFNPSADKCIECGICETRCPYDLPIRKMLKEVHSNLGS